MVPASSNSMWISSRMSQSSAGLADERHHGHPKFGPTLPQNPARVEDPRAPRHVGNGWERGASKRGHEQSFKARCKNASPRLSSRVNRRDPVSFDKLFLSNQADASHEKAIEHCKRSWFSRKGMSVGDIYIYIDPQW